jgi:hypothetical protein
MTPMKEGQPIPAGAFHIEQIAGTQRFKVEEVGGVSGSTKGPAKVNSQAFRNNWDGIFGKKQVVGEA